MNMDIKYKKWEAIILKGVAPFGLRITKEQIRLFYLHALELMQWSRKINLTAITEHNEIAIKHFVDSIAPLPYLPPMKNVLDVGSGGGFPGIPLKVIHPEIELTLVDAVRKKTSFMQHVIRKLKLNKAKAVHSRVENFRDQGGAFVPYDTIVCRAFSDLSLIIPKVLPLLTPGGEVVVWKGRTPEKEINKFKARFPDQALSLRIQINSYRLPIYDAERNLVRIKTCKDARENLHYSKDTEFI